MNWQQTCERAKADETLVKIARGTVATNRAGTHPRDNVGYAMFRDRCAELGIEVPSDAYYSFLLASCAAPPLMHVALTRRKTVPVSSFEEASKVCRKYITDRGLGSNWYGGDISDSSGKIVAHVSYNGRVWEGSCRDWQPNTQELCVTK